MSEGIVHKIGRVVEFEKPARAESRDFSDERPTLADLVLPGSGYKFSDEFTCLLRVLGGDVA